MNRLDAIRKLRDEGYAVVDRENYESLRRALRSRSPRPLHFEEVVGPLSVESADEASAHSEQPGTG